ncbi:class E sortase [Corynebacterium mayonis]|uniref:class E sortase n=1 Tax=Corynebacterium mayonis TaxID=3062461 RepID=UPI0031405DCF
MPSVAPTVPAAQPHRRRITSGEILGELFLTIGALLLLFAFYESFWTNVHSGQLQKAAQEQLEQQWVNPRAAKSIELGDAFARMYIPAFGPDFQFAIIEGVEEKELLAGPGRYPDSQMPGEPGNFAVAGHRVGKGAPFNDLGRLNSCDSIVVETRQEWVTYRVMPMSSDPAERAAEAASCLDKDQTQRVAHGDYSHVKGRHITVPSNVSVIDPLPENNAVEVSEALEGVITLTTCHPQFSNAERMIIHAVQTEVVEKPAPAPEALTEVS